MGCDESVWRLSFFPVGETDQMNKSDVTGGYEDKGMVWVPVRMVLMSAVRSYSRLLMEVGWHIIIEGFCLLNVSRTIRPDEVPPRTRRK